MIKPIVALAVFLAGATLLAGCSAPGSSGTRKPGAVMGAGCAPVAGDALRVLTDDRHLQTADNIIPAISARAATPAAIAVLDRVSQALDTPKLIELNRRVDIDRRTPKVAAEEFIKSAGLARDLPRGTGRLTVGSAGFSESQTLGQLYQQTLSAAGFDATVRPVGNRELYEPALERGEISIVPEYIGTLAEFLNKKVNGAAAPPVASADPVTTTAALKQLGARVGLAFGDPSDAADQNAFAVTEAFASRYDLITTSDFATKCSGRASILAGPPECPDRPFCQLGLERTYDLGFGRFLALDAGGPLTKTALRTGEATLGLVLSADGGLQPR